MTHDFSGDSKRQKLFKKKDGVAYIQKGKLTKKIIKKTNIPMRKLTDLFVADATNRTEKT